MRILIVNDDGIKAEGIKHLAALAIELADEVWVVAPKRQCSAMSHRITLFEKIDVRREDFPVEGVRAYSVDGTPADCVKVALEYLMEEKPDLVFSGINFGFNTGVDIVYSGTVGAAMEALVSGIRSFAFSNKLGGSFDTADAYLVPLVREMLDKGLAMDRIWNVNFPGCSLDECQGVRWGCIPAKHQFYLDCYERTDNDDGSFQLMSAGAMVDTADEGTDVKAVLDNYISIGEIRCEVLGYDKK